PAMSCERPLDLPSARQEILDLVEKPAPGRIAFQDQVVAPFERHEARAGNAGRKPASFLEWLHRIVTAMKYERRRADARQQIDHVDVVHRTAQPPGVLR